MTQPGLTGQNQELERELGVSLFDRSHRPIRTTAVGASLLNQVHAVLAYLDEADRAIDLLVAQHRRTRLTLGVTYQPSSKRFLAALAEFGELHPEISIALEEHLRADLLKLMREGELDACVLPMALREEMLSPECRHIRVFSWDWVFVVPAGHRLANRGQVSVSELVDERFVLSVGRSGGAVRRALRLAGVQAHVSWETNGTNVIPSLVGEGVGIGYVPEFQVQRAQVPLKSFKVDGVDFGYHAVLAWVDRPAHPDPLRWFIEFVKSCEWED
jgi:DNA-binding transcriptional LysR family regulator